MLEKQLTGEQIDDLVDGLVRGEYNLLFGAGASIGALAKDTSKLPDADTLATVNFHQHSPTRFSPPFTQARRSELVRQPIIACF